MDLINAYLKNILEEKPFRKLPTTFLRKPYSDEKVVKAPSLKGVPCYVIAGCTPDDSFGFLLMVPSQVNWQDYEFEPDKYDPYIKPYGFFSLYYSDLLKPNLKTWNEFEATNILKKSIDVNKYMKFKKIYIKEKIKCDVETLVLKGEGTWRPFRMMLKNVKSKIFKNIIDIRLSADIHDYNVFVINKKSFKEDFYKSMPPCSVIEKPKGIIKNPVVNIKNNTGFIYGIGWNGKKTNGSYNSPKNASIDITLYLKFNNVMFQGGGDVWKETSKAIYSWDYSGHPIPTARLQNKSPKLELYIPKEVANLIQNMKTVVDFKSVEFDREKHYTVYSFFGFEPKNVVYKRDGNNIEINDIKNIKQLAQTRFKFSRLTANWDEKNTKITGDKWKTSLLTLLK